MNKRKGGYDPMCASVDTGLRAVWLLHSRGKWSLLEELGLSRSEHQEGFEGFGDTISGRVPNKKEVVRFGLSVPGALRAAEALTSRYKTLYGIQESI
jgi:hypothetical protein